MNTEWPLWALWAAGGAGAYLLGSVPFGFLLAKARGKDIRTLGSGNIGATNVFRSVGKGPGLLTFLLDFLKGLAAVCLVPRLAGWLAAGGCAAAAAAGIPFRLFCGALAVAGHNWTCFLGFKGGKGVATSAGMLLGLTPGGAGIAFAVWVLAFVSTRYVSVASILAAAALGAAAWPLYAREGALLPGVLTALACLAVWKHRSNIRRLLSGTESRFTFKKAK